MKLNRKKFKEIIQTCFPKKGFFTMLNTLAILIVSQTVNVTCVWVHYQPELPNESEKFRKFKAKL